jgi:transposase-like protein
MTITTITRFKKYPKEIFQRIRKLRWKEGVYCTNCGSFSVKLHQREKRGLYRYRCNDCKKLFSDLSKTIFESTKIPLWKWFFAIYETGQKSGISSIELADKLNVNQKTAWRMLDRIRTSFLKYQPLLEGLVEGDETYIGGKQKGKRGRCVRWSNKVCVAGLVERKGKANIEVIDYINEEALTSFVMRNVKEDSKVCTDAFGGYNGLNYAGFEHETINHNKEFVRGQVHTQTIEGLWAFIKRKLRGTYYKVAPHNLLKYLKEFVLRYNLRANTAQSRFNFMLSFTLNTI